MTKEKWAKGGRMVLAVRMGHGPEPEAGTVSFQRVEKARSVPPLEPPKRNDALEIL